MKKRFYSILPLLLSLLVLFSGCSLQQGAFRDTNTVSMVSLEEIPAFQEAPYTEINGNQPNFSDEEKTSESFETYSDLDYLGRCGTAYACIGQDLMPTEDRESISQIKPTGWQTAEYDFIDGKYLYNRCHLIGFQLAGENANEKNLIAGTRYMNVEGMLPFENMTADYIKETGNHVLYRVTPVFKENELVARGVQMEAWSIEDNGDGVCFNVYVYNNQPGVVIDYQTGESRAEEKLTGSTEESQPSVAQSEEYIVNTSTHKFHLPSCPSVGAMKEKNKQEYYGSREYLIEEGYAPCQNCKP